MLTSSVFVMTPCGARKVVVLLLLPLLLNAKVLGPDKTPGIAPPVVDGGEGGGQMLGIT
jgi:hypothetical protein